MLGVLPQSGRFELRLGVESSHQLVDRPSDCFSHHVMHASRRNAKTYALLGMTVVALISAASIADLHISDAQTEAVEPLNSADCQLAKLAIQTAYPRFLEANGPTIITHGPMLGCSKTTSGIEVQKISRERQGFVPPHMTVNGPFRSITNTSALVFLSLGDSIQGSGASCRLQRWPWGWSVLSCRHSRYLA